MQTVKPHGHRSKRGVGSRRAHGTTEPAGPPPPASPLTASVLVLNRLYLAVHVVGARRAFALLCRELVEVIHFEEGALATYTFDMWREASKLRANSKQPHEDWVRAVNFEIQVPRVVRLLTYDRLPRQHVHLNRRSVLARDGHQCQYCGRHFPIQQLSLDHVLPRSRGGTTTWENVVCACLGCNVRKGGRTPHEAKMTLICRPTKPRRNPLLLTRLNNPKYESWRTWLDGVYWDIGARD